jgi:methylated-DNA-[protein]-cysteine S-methyltransferase
LTPRYTVVETRFGWVVINGSEAGLTLVTLPRPSIEMSLEEHKASMISAVEDEYAFGDLPLRLQSYFEGKRPPFLDKLDLSNTTEFQAAVWNATRSVPYGETRSYAWIAAHIGRPRAWRAVGNALSRNPFPIIVPCHRVIASDGQLGGFGGGPEIKKVLLNLEAKGQPV